MVIFPVGIAIKLGVNLKFFFTGSVYISLVPVAVKYKPF
jgi:hypothetical protein